MKQKPVEALRRFNDSAPKCRLLSIDDNGITLKSKKSNRILWQVKWQSVNEVVAFTIDAGVVDHICIGITQKDDEAMHITDEGTPGWQDLLKALELRYGIENSSWLGKVADPPYATNWSVLWQRGT